MGERIPESPHGMCDPLKDSSYYWYRETITQILHFPMEAKTHSSIPRIRSGFRDGMITVKMPRGKSNKE